MLAKSAGLVREKASSVDLCLKTARCVGEPEAGADVEVDADARLGVPAVVPHAESELGGQHRCPSEHEGLARLNGCPQASWWFDCANTSTSASENGTKAENSGAFGTDARGQWVRKVETEYRNADATRGCLLDVPRLVVEQCDQLRKRCPFPGFGVYPVLLSTVVGQQEATSPAD